MYKRGAHEGAPSTISYSCITFVLVECSDKSCLFLFRENPVGVVLWGLLGRDLNYRILFDPSLEELILLKYGQLRLYFLSRCFDGRGVALVILILVSVFLGTASVSLGSLVALPLLHCINLVFVFFIELLLGLSQLLLKSDLSLLFFLD